MNKILLFLTLMIMTSGYAENLVLDNQTSYPGKDQTSKIAIQWSTSAKEVADSNQAVILSIPLNSDTIQTLTQTGKITIDIPQGAEYFRIVAWSGNQEEPDALTNWVDVIPDKVYTLKSDDLVPTVLMVGMGC